MPNQVITHTIIQGDTLTPLRVQLMQGGSAVNLDGTTVTFVMYGTDGVAITLSGSVSVATASEGKVQFQFHADDVATPGTYYGYFKVTVSSATDTYPHDGAKLKIVIKALGTS